MNAYEKLYSDMKNRFTVINENHEYSLGDYMLLKAGRKKEAESNLPVRAASSSNQKAITAFFRYVNDKLTVKAPPVKDKTMRAFPFRTSAAALLSAALVCTLVISYGSVTVSNKTASPVSTVSVSETEVCEDTETSVNLPVD